MKKILFKCRFIIGAVILTIISLIFISIMGKQYTFNVDEFYNLEGLQNEKVYVEEDCKDIIELIDYSVSDDNIQLTVRGKKPGKAFILMGEDAVLDVFYVHNNLVVTINDYFGVCGGSTQVSVLWFLYFIWIFIAFILKYKNGLKENMYSYKNILYLGFIIFMGYSLYVYFTALFRGGGLLERVFVYMDAVNTFVYLTLPVIVIVTILVSISNVTLMRKEGRNWRNMLGFFLGIGLCLGVIIPNLFDFLLVLTNKFNIYDYQGIPRFVEMFIMNLISSIMCYIECILAGTIVVGIVAARHVPKTDKDYIIILGCMISKDGSLTKLLKGRADRAIEYAKLQKKRSGQDIIFVASGGQGSDEIMPEGEAIKNYLLSEGIDEDHILVEDKSINTNQNFRYSFKIIKNHWATREDIKEKDMDPRIAFSTTNYHVFRSGMLANRRHVHTEGVGARTVSYFWVNAFIREFIATLVTERQRHILVVFALFFLNVIAVAFTYISNVVLN